MSLIVAKRGFVSSFITITLAWLAMLLSNSVIHGLVRVRLDLYQTWVGVQQNWEVSNLPSYYKALKSESITVYHFEADRDVALVVQDLIKDYFDVVASDLVTGTARRDGIKVVVSPTVPALESSLGERYGRNAMGAYWRGVIWVLSPVEWLDLTDPLWPEDFRRSGPVIHEMTHLILDRSTAGNIPVWLDEGIAQYEEFKQLGYEWIEPANRLDQPLYSLSQLADDFTGLANEPLAYREAHLLVRYLIESKGEKVLVRLVKSLAAGVPAKRALEKVYGSDFSVLERDWSAWLAGQSDALAGPDSQRGDAGWR